MNKAERQQLIQTMIRQEKIRTQAEIKQGLEQHGISVTQTTLSRDLRELGLVKMHENGSSYYSLSRSEEADFSQLLAQYAYKVERASFILVLHSELGEAALMANIIDIEKPATILGTLAGADTLLVICRDEEAAKQVEAEINSYLD
ncbi:arginine repressor [Streptococcus azizii]|uniref:Arginine repressor n=1 Tax=Streptococcus azizii TaxID=1579424 RepID=A0AB36JRS3_9STRE|nr:MULTISPECIES: arginine repressor [Streptococcus]MBF0776903.1 arginine repressor [Streptococcus sp. 19428wD3_AN2]ONK28838.1 arginine repressor [Streptococcus azizii]ONK30349.1 arginine repressor [Streptococcus azizii]ONK31171.1 arginine repressor [Streptococcus azizii]TFU82188.1 arginine repressor [Streptococcus sp. AN2]